MLKEERAMKQVVLDGLVFFFKAIANYLFFFDAIDIFYNRRSFINCCLRFARRTPMICSRCDIVQLLIEYVGIIFLKMGHVDK